MGRSGFLAVLVTASACGRIAIDPRTDALPDAPDAQPQHDEDGDRVVDNEDICPHISDEGQPDMDGDRVGDACDPEPALARQRIVSFDPFVVPTTWQFTATTAPSFDGDSVSADTTEGELFATLSKVPANDLVIVGGRVGATSATNRRQLSINAAQNDLAFYYCELYEFMGIQKFGLVWTPDNFTFNTVASGTKTETLANHDFRLTLATGPGQKSCTTTFPVDMPVLSSAIDGITPTKLVVYVQGAVIRYDYALVIRTD